MNVKGRQYRTLWERVLEALEGGRNLAEENKKSWIGSASKSSMI
jgi:hypothetical protein